MKSILIALTMLVATPLFAQNKKVTKAEKNVYIIHGYDSTIDKHWFKWLDQALQKEGIKVKRVQMSSPANPKVEEWLSQMRKEVKTNSETVIVAHSLGTITTLSFLTEANEPIKGTVLVSGFYKMISDDFLFLNPFVEKFANRKSEPKTGKAVVISALDDTIVPQQFSDELSQLLHCEFIRLPKGGHFLDREGVTSFPLVLEQILKMYKD